MNKKYLSLVIILLMSAALMISGNQTETNTPNPAPTVNTGLKYLRVIVLNDDDEHISGLKKEQFKLSINGEDQRISSVKEINLLTGDEDSRQYNQNLLKEDPVYHVIMIANIPQDARQVSKMKDGLLDFLSENENSGAPIGIFILTPSGITKLTDMTTDINVLNAEVINAFSRKMFCNEMSFFMEDTKFALIKHLAEFALSLVNIPGSKDLIILSAGIPDTFGLNYYDTMTNPIVNSGSSDAEVQARKGSQSLDQQRLEAKARKEFGDSLRGLSGLLSKSNIKIDFVDLSKTTRSSRAGLGLADSRSSISSGASSSNDASGFANTGDQYNFGVSLKVDTEVKLRIARDLASAGGGEMFEKGLSSSGQLTDYLNQILYNNAHYYIIEFKPAVDTTSDEKIVDLNLEVKNDDAEKVIYNKNLFLE